MDGMCVLRYLVVVLTYLSLVKGFPLRESTAMILPSAERPRLLQRRAIPLFVRMSMQGADNSEDLHGEKNQRNLQLEEESNTKGFVSEGMEKRIISGSVTARDLERVFKPTKREIQDLNNGKRLPLGHAAMIIPIEGVLADTSILAEYFSMAYSILIKELGLTGSLDPPTTDRGFSDAIGISFADSVMSLGWPRQLAKSYLAEATFYSILMKLIDERSEDFRLLRPGADILLYKLLQEKNEVAIRSVLPRAVALKLLQKMRLTGLLRESLSPDRLVCAAAKIDADFPDSMSDDGSQSRSVLPLLATEDELFSGQQIVQCCALLRRPPMFTVAIEAHPKCILAAKRAGLVVMAIKESQTNSYLLRSADKVVASLKDIETRNIYELIESVYVRSRGPVPEAAAAEALLRSTTTTTRARSIVASPEQENRKRDTFAEEFGSDNS